MSVSALRLARLGFLSYPITMYGDAWNVLKSFNRYILEDMFSWSNSCLSPFIVNTSLHDHSEH